MRNKANHTLPTIHLNGTHPKDLHEQALAVHATCFNLLHVLRAATPHGRDYYTQGPQALLAATVAHNARLDAVRMIQDWAEEVAHVCLDSPRMRKS